MRICSGLLGVLAGWLVLFQPLSAQTSTLNPSQDNTIFQVTSIGSQQLSNGAGDRIQSGRNNMPSNSIRRGLLQFDLSSIPAGSTITSVALTMNLQSAPLPGDNRTVELHRVLRNWGEGSSVAGGGGGANSITPDASWFYNTFNTSQWTTPGGDFSSTVSGSAVVGGQETIGQDYAWLSTPFMIADVQAWLDTPASNFGWILLGDEAQQQTARGFASSEYTTDPTKVPRLVVTYSAVPEPSNLTLICLLTAGTLAWTWRRRKRLA